MFVDLPYLQPLPVPCDTACHWRRARQHLPEWVNGALARLRGCESGGDYTIATGNGYYGAYQYDVATWQNAAGGSATANLASPAEQDVRTWRLIRREGVGRWPVCGRYW